MPNLIIRLWSHIKFRRRKQLGALVVVMIIASFAEAISIGAVLPFLAVLTSPETLFNNELLQQYFKIFNLTEPKELLFPLTIIFIVAALLSALTRALMVWLQIRLGHAIGSDISVEIYQRTLYQPYQVHIFRNSSQIISGMSGKVNSVVYHTILPILTITSSILILISILTAMIIINPWMTITTFGGISLIYFFISLATKKQLSHNSQKISQNSNQVIKALQEGLGGIRDILIDGLQKTYCTIYASAEIAYRRAQAINQIIGIVPRYFIEAFGMSLIAILAYRMSVVETSFAQAIPILGALVLGAQRLLPVAQQIYQSWSSIKSGQAPLRDVVDLISQPLPKSLTNSDVEPILFEESIRLNNVSFRYSNNESNILSNLNLEIKKGSRIGIVGATGSGKSTLLDIFMGLLTPTDGRLEIDGEPITHKNDRRWQARIAHVPQSIFLADISIAENIAFGLPLEKIDFQRVELVTEKAQLAKTIKSWKEKYLTLVGERGVRLSGGQRQRIGIARALYKQADVIIFDEATSALDSETELEIVKAINSIGRDVTIIVAAHRQSTLASCDKIYEISNGLIRNFR